MLKIQLPFFRDFERLAVKKSLVFVEVSVLLGRSTLVGELPVIFLALIAPLSFLLLLGCLAKRPSEGSELRASGNQGDSARSCPRWVQGAAIPKPWCPAPRDQDHDWMSLKEWYQRVSALRNDPKRAKAELALMGDSITQKWRDSESELGNTDFGAYQPLILGVGGDRTQNLLWRIDSGELDKLHLKALMILIGTNNIGNGDSPEDTFHGIQEVVRRARGKLPTAKILLLALLPRGDGTPDQVIKTKAMIGKINDLLEGWAQGAEGRSLRVSFSRKSANLFLTHDGNVNTSLMEPDAIHPNHTGCVQWGSVLKSEVTELLK